jgi:hypothetical protein
MPHFGQSPGVSLSTPGHMGQKYFATAEGVTGSPPWFGWEGIGPA